MSALFVSDLFVADLFAPDLFVGGDVTWYLTNQTTPDGWPVLQHAGAAPATLSTGTGWAYSALPAGQHSRMAHGVVRASGTFAGTAQPSGGPDNTLKDCWRTLNRWTIDVGAGTWTVAVPVIAVTEPGATGRVRARVWTSPNADGSGATERSVGAVAGTAVTALGTGAAQTSTVTFQLSLVNVSSVYLFVQVAFETL